MAHAHKIAKPGLPSEICGVFEGETVHPKSFDFIAKEPAKLRLAYNGLFFLLGDFRKSKDFTSAFVERTKIKSGEPTPIIHVLKAFEAAVDEIRRMPPPTFTKEKQYNLPIKGKLHLNESLLKGLGVSTKTVKTVNTIYSESIERSFILAALPFLGQRLPRCLNAESSSIVSKLIDEARFLLRDENTKSGDLYRLAESVERKQITWIQNDKLLSYCKILAAFILDDYFQEPKKKSTGQTHIDLDYLLNLNRPFELLIKKLINRVDVRKPDEPFARFFIKRNPLSEVRETIRNMYPDAWGFLNGDRTKGLWIVDAKHKIFASDFDDKEDDTNREDIFQLTSYIRANLQKEVGVFGLFGLVKENASAPNRFISSLVPVGFDIDKNGERTEILINRLTMRFGSVLLEIGRIIEQRNSEAVLQIFYNRLAAEMLGSLDKRSLKIHAPHVLAETLPNHLIKTDFGCRLDLVRELAGNELATLMRYFFERCLGNLTADTIRSSDGKFLKAAPTQYRGSQKFDVYAIDTSVADSRAFFREKLINADRAHDLISILISATDINVFGDGETVIEQFSGDYSDSDFASKFEALLNTINTE